MSNLRGFKKVNSDNSELAKVQENIDVALKPVLDAAIISGILVKQVSLLSTQDNIIDHKLGREYRGYIVVDKNANANIWTASTKFKQSQLVLATSIDVVVSLWVF